MEIFRVRTDQAVPGMIVANDIYTMNNQLIITKGTELNEKVITKLRFYSIYGFNVYQEIWGGRKPRGILYSNTSKFPRLQEI